MTCRAASPAASSPWAQNSGGITELSLRDLGARPTPGRSSSASWSIRPILKGTERIRSRALILYDKDTSLREGNKSGVALADSVSRWAWDPAIAAARCRCCQVRLLTTDLTGGSVPVTDLSCGDLMKCLVEYSLDQGGGVLVKVGEPLAGSVMRGLGRDLAVRLNAQTGVIIASVAAEANFTVSVIRRRHGAEDG